MSNVTELKDHLNTKTLHLVLLTIVTAGIFPIMGLYRNYSGFDKITGSQTATNSFLIWMAVCAGLSGALAGSGDEVLESISGILSIALAVLYIVWAFRARKALQSYALNVHKTDLRMNVFYTIGLQVFYINYCVNDLPEAKRKQQILSNTEQAQAAQ